MKKVIKGWMLRQEDLHEAFHWGYGDNPTLQTYMYRHKGKKNAYLRRNWPPRRVVVTIEVEE